MFSAEGTIVLYGGEPWDQTIAEVVGHTRMGFPCSAFREPLARVEPKQIFPRCRHHCVKERILRCQRTGSPGPNLAGEDIIQRLTGGKADHRTFFVLLFGVFPNVPDQRSPSRPRPNVLTPFSFANVIVRFVVTVWLTAWLLSDFRNQTKLLLPLALVGNGLGLEAFALWLQYRRQSPETFRRFGAYATVAGAAVMFFLLW